jgi:iron complex transport system permease protein
MTGTAGHPVRTRPRPTAGVPGRVLRTRHERFSVRVHGWALGVGAVLAVALAIVSLAFLTTGDYGISVPDVFRTIAGSGPPGADFVVNTLRLPRLLTGLLVGMALGVSGAIFQRISANPLGSPDIIGFTTGSATGAVLVILVAHGGMYQTAGGALAGGLVTAALVYLLAYRNGVTGLRLILIGVGLDAMLLSVNYYLITRVAPQEALVAQAWLIGSLNGRTWTHVGAIAAALVVLLPLAATQARRLALMELGDDAATGLGIPVQRSRLTLVLAGVGLAAVATAVSGPIGFVALAAPQLARRLTRSAGPGLLAAALMGALLLVGSDLAIGRLFRSAQLPVGIATAAIGGLYLAGLLVHEWRRERR